MKIAVVILIFILIPLWDFSKLSREKNRKKTLIIYFFLLFLGCSISIVQLMIETPSGPLMLLKMMLDTILDGS